ncbi:reverse transcriptase domain-containing protein [Tanacetum coccineum]|uniref:Reverse transcriptase domain-containing protein n=1 Tax=Tanacetum coccineum TaxID=301880 RepID=A0ABQ5BDX2_9ASTR
MRTRNSYFPNNSNVTILRRRNKGRAPNIVEPELRTIVAPMAERTMEELLRAPTEGYGESCCFTTLVEFSTLVEIVSKKVVTPAPVKAVEESCVTCGGAHSWYNCPATDNNQASVCATTGTYNQVNPPNRVSNQMAPPGFAPVQNNGQNRYNQNQVQGNNFWGNNFHGNQVERETEETTDKEQTNFQGSTAQIPPPVIPISIPEPDIPKTLPKTTPIPESDIPKSLPNFADALLLMPRFAPTIKSLLMNKEKLLELAKIPLNENCSAMLLKKLPEKLGDPGKFLILYQTTRYSSTNDKSVNRIDIIDAVCEEYAPEFLGFPNSSGGNPTPTSEPFTSEFILEEIEAYLKDDSISPEIDHADCNPEEDILHYVPKKGGITVAANEENELIPTRLVTGWRVCIDYRKLNEATRKDHFPLSFMDQMLERLAGNEFYCFLDGFSGYFQIPIDPQDQEKTTFTCPYGTFAYRRMPFGLCNAPGTFQRCMMAIFHDMIEKTMEVFMDDFSVFGDSFDSCLSNLEKMLKRCEDTNLVLNWEKCHFMCREGIVLGHKISKSGIEVDRAKVDVIAKLPHPTTVKGTLKKKLTEAPILVVPDWNLPFKLMCDASDFAIGAVLGQRKMKHFQPIHYASKTMTEAQIHYTTTKKEMLAVVYAFEKFRPYLVLSKSIVVYGDTTAFKVPHDKQDAKPRLLRWVLLLQEFDITIRDKKRK